jgi:hypothetical protein
VKSTSLFKSLALAVGILAAGTAAASPITLGSQVNIDDAQFWDPINLSSSVKVSINGVGSTIRSGLFDIDATTVPGGDYVRLLAFCLQPDVLLRKYDNPYTAVDIGSSAVVGDATAYRDDVVDGVSAAAFQVAVWELAFDGDDDLSSGNFQSTNPSAVLTLANTWLASLGSLTATAKNLVVLQDDPQGPYGDKQDLLIQTPIPGTLGLVGLGLLGLGGLRRKKKV